MNKRLSDLSNCLVIGSAQRQKKFDKITILKMAVEHMKNSKGYDRFYFYNLTIILLGFE